MSLAQVKEFIYKDHIAGLGRARYSSFNWYRATNVDNEVFCFRFLKGGSPHSFNDYIELTKIVDVDGPFKTRKEAQRIDGTQLQIIYKGGTMDQHLREKVHHWLEYATGVDVRAEDRATRDVVEFAQELHRTDPREIGDITVVTNEAGECVAVTRTDGYGKVFSVIWEKKQ